MMESRNVNFHEYSEQRLKSCLRDFVELNNVEAVKLAIEKGASVNTEDRAGLTPLHLAAMSNNTLQCLKELLKSETVNINKKSGFGLTAVAHSCKTGSWKILKTLIEHGADVNLSNFKKLTPLHLACWKDCLKAVKLLIKAGADVNAKDERDWTPLHEATSFASVKVCQYLLEHGADPNIPNEDGLLPIHVAVNKRNCEVYDIIRSNTKSDTLLKYCTFTMPNGDNIINRSILCLAVDSHNKAVIESVMKSGLPNDVLNCPIVVEEPFFLNDYLDEDEEEESFEEKLILLSPLCFLLINYYNFQEKDFADMLSLIHHKKCISSTFNSSDSLYVPGCIEVILRSSYSEIDRFKITNMLLENRTDADEICVDIPAELLKKSLTLDFDKSIFMLLLKASNIVEPEDILRWIIDNRKKEFLQFCITQDLIYALLVLSPYVPVTSSVYYDFLKLKCHSVEEKNVSEKIKQVCERSVWPLASYCRSVIRQQLHRETMNNHRQFTEMLNSLPLPKMIISYLKFSEVKFTVCERTERVKCEIVCSL